jgi:isocitrate dehydrogenase
MHGHHVPAFFFILTRTTTDMDRPNHGSAGTAAATSGQSSSTIGAPAKIPVTIAYGDGIGPEIMEATLRILEAAGAPLRYEVIEIGEKLYEQGHTSGIAPEAWETIRRNHVFLKAPITTPLGGGYKSLNVTIRKSLNLFANVRPTKSYAPFVASPHPGINLVIIRENEEDLYAGIEHQQTNEVTQVLKLISYPGSERIVRYAFEYARAYGRRKVTCMTKDNIMKITDGLFHRVFDKVATEYPEIESEHMIIDIGAARVAAQPEWFDVIVTLNLYGDILSDIASQVAGSVGLAGSANVGEKVAMFEAIHGSAPDIAGKDVANPSGLLLAATQMLVHLGEARMAETIKNAWLCTLESGIHTADVYRPRLSKREVGTEDFTNAVIENLGQQPNHLSPVQYRRGGISVSSSPMASVDKQLVGIDVFLDWSEEGRDPNRLGRGLEGAAPPAWRLRMITNRGVKVYPEGLPETFRTDHWRCRFLPADGDTARFEQVLDLLRALHQAGYEVIKTEHLYTFNGERGYSLGQGE